MRIIEIVSLEFQFPIQNAEIGRIIQKCLEPIPTKSNACTCADCRITSNKHKQFYEKWNFSNCCGAKCHRRQMCSYQMPGKYRFQLFRLQGISFRGFVGIGHWWTQIISFAVGVDVRSYGREGVLFKRGSQMQLTPIANIARTWTALF